MIYDDSSSDESLESLRLSDSEESYTNEDFKNDVEDKLLKGIKMFIGRNYGTHKKLEEYFRGFDNNNKKDDVKPNLNSPKDNKIDHNGIDKLSNGKNELQLTDGKKSDCKSEKNNISNADDKDGGAANEEEESKLKSTRQKKRPGRPCKRKLKSNKRRRLNQENTEIISIAKNMDEVNTRQTQSVNETVGVQVDEECGENKTSNEDVKNRCDKNSIEDKRNRLDIVEVENGIDKTTFEEESSNKDNREIPEDNTKAVNNKRPASTIFEEQLQNMKLEDEYDQQKKILTNFKSLSDYMSSVKIRRLTRADLEEFCSQKIVEILSISSENSEARHKIKALELQIEQNRKDTQEISKQYKELYIVHNKLLTEFSNHRRTHKCVQPIKITRSVGIQVAIKPNNDMPLISVKTETVAAEVQQQPQNNTNNQAVVINMSNVVNGSGMKNYNDVNKKGDDEYITGDDESTSDTTTTTKRLCKSVAAVTTGGTTNNIITTQSAAVSGIGSSTGECLSTAPVITAGTSAETSSSISTTNGTLHSLQSNTVQIRLPPPLLILSKSDCGTGIVVLWKMPHDLSKYEVIGSYELFVYQEKPDDIPSPDNWTKIDKIKALPLPMAVTLTNFVTGYFYFFCVRAVDVSERLGTLSDTCSIFF